MNGSFWNEGCVEVYEFGGWGLVCSIEWDIMDVSVVCKVVGFKYGYFYIYIGFKGDI